jgi:enoyl-CoA hydratase
MSVRAEPAGEVLVVTIDRPEARNAVNLAVAEGIAAAMERLDEDDSLRTGILTGAGGTFCAGMDLKAFVAGERPYVEGRGFAGLAEGPPRKPLIAAVEGWALAGGFEVALACDLIVAARDARFVSRLTEPGGALEGARDLAAHIARNGPMAIDASKRIIAAAADWPQAEAWERQAEVTGPVFASEDAREGATAFAEKRDPVWRGR